MGIAAHHRASREFSCACGLSSHSLTHLAHHCPSEMTERTRASWLVYVLGALCAGAILAAFLLVGPASQSAVTQSRIVRAQQGVVQSTVSGSGTLAPARKASVNFSSSGTLTGLFVSVGEHVYSGKLLAEIDPGSAESSLRSAEMNLTSEEATYQAALEGLTPVEVRENQITATQSRASVKSAHQSVRQAQETARSDAAAARAAVAQAQTSLKQSEQSVRLETSTQRDGLNEAVSQRGADEKAVTEAQAQLEEARALLAGEKTKASSESKSATGQSGVGSAESKVSSTESAVRSAQAKVTQDGNSILSAQNNQAAAALKGQQSIQGARNTLANERQSQAATRLKDDQSIAQARTSLATAQESLQATLASNEAKAAPPTRATVVSAENSVKSAQLTVENARKTLAETKLYAPTEGVVASIKDSIGETVSGTGGSSSETSAGTGATSSSSSSTTASKSATGNTGDTGSSTAGTGTSSASGVTGAGNSGGAGEAATDGGGRSPTGDSDAGTFHDIADIDIAASSATGAGAATGSGAGSATTASSASTSGESSSSSFIELIDLSGYQLVVALSESEIVHVHAGQLATVTVEALEGRKFAAHVVSVAVLATSNSGVVSYDVTFQLDQVEPGLKPGMSATAEVVVNQEAGVNVPTSAISGGSVTVVQNGKQVRRRVRTGLAGNSTTIVLSGVKAGEEVALPVAASTSSATSLTSRLAGRLGGGLGGLGGGLGGGGLGGGGGGGGAFFRGG
jgi:multidrug efflux pump subunit AcrA (membrane-fusion protein)